MDAILVRVVMGILGLAIVLGGLYLFCAAVITLGLFVWRLVARMLRRLGFDDMSRRAEIMRLRVLSVVGPLAPPGVSRTPYTPPSEPPGV